MLFQRPGEYPLCLHDGGRNLSRRPLQINDCTVRALAIGAGVTYDTAYDYLKAQGRQCNDGFELCIWLRNRKNLFEKKIKKEKIETPMSIMTFMKKFPRGTYLCELIDHVFIVKNGIAYDLWRQKGKNVLAVWKFI